LTGQLLQYHATSPIGDKLNPTYSEKRSHCAYLALQKNKTKAIKLEKIPNEIVEKSGGSMTNRFDCLGFCKKLLIVDTISRLPWA
jgi:hypothetical protein